MRPLAVGARLHNLTSLRRGITVAEIAAAAFAPTAGLHKLGLSAKGRFHRSLPRLNQRTHRVAGGAFLEPLFAQRLQTKVSIRYSPKSVGKIAYRR